MARIRTIKPDFFKHDGLFDAEQESGLPLRLAFIGLWTVADREGRFAWRPRQLKTDALPYDEVDFSRVLDALASRGFIVKYASGDEHFGYIPSWNKHQVINNRETASCLPEPIDIADNSDASSTRRPRDTEMLEGKGREGKGKGREKEKGGAEAPTAEYAFVGKIIRLNVKDFDQWRKNYPLIGDLVGELTKADAYYSDTPPADGKWFFPVSSWLKRENDRQAENQKANGTYGQPTFADKNGNLPGDPYYGVDY